MGYFVKLCIVGLTVTMYMQSIHSATNADKGINKVLTENSVNYGPDFPYLTLTTAKPIGLTMNTDLSVTFNYTIPCNDKTVSHLVQFKSGSPNLFSIKGKTNFEIDCNIGDSVKDSATEQSDHDRSNSTNKALGQIMTNDMKISVVQGTIQVKLNGILLGIGTLEVQLKRFRSNFTTDVRESTDYADVIESKYTVNIIRVMRPVDTAFRVIVRCFVAMVIMGFGCSLDLKIVKECLKKPIAPGLGLACQYILMPLIGFTVAKLVPIENRAVAFGIFVCGVCPGGGASNVYSYLLGGDINLSITMTCISSTVALGLMPLWVYTLGRQFVDEDFHVVIPYANMLQTLALITIPLFIGILFKHKFQEASMKFVKLLKPITFIAMLIFMIVGTYSNFYIFKLIQPVYIIAGGLLPYIGYLAGGIVAFIFRQPWTRIKTIAIETGMQNTSVAFLIMVTSFPPPLGDIAAMAPVTSKMATPIPPFIITIFYLLYKRYKKSNEVAPDQSIDKTTLKDSETDCANFLVNSEYIADDKRENKYQENHRTVVENISSV